VTEQDSRAGPEPTIDTIAAVATAPGLGAVAVVRLSGDRSFDILRALTPDHPPPVPTRSPRLLSLRDKEGALLDRALVTAFPGPESYTGEDVVEISSHGGWLVPAMVLEACLAEGARAAEPGEFTRRAVLNGKMDLVQAEAVLDLVEGHSKALHDSALFQLDQGLSRRIGELHEQVVTVQALLVHHIDFPEEDEAPVSVERVMEEAGALVLALNELLATAPEGELLREGALTVLAGLPNSGKSSLFNALLGQDRAIVTEIPGTTRDALEAVVSLGGFPFRLVDTAGFRDTEEAVERLGIEVARRYLDRADLVLLCVEGVREFLPEEVNFLEELAEVPVVVLRTKADLTESATAEIPSTGETPAAAEIIEISVFDGTGVARLRECLPALVYLGFVHTGVAVPALTRARQREGVRSARDHVADFIEALEGAVPAEMASTHLRPAETALEELLGVIPNDEVLDRVFRDFCIGK
jgi:tRNA modification GTPase